MQDKDRLRKELRAARRSHVESLPESTRSLLFLRPPTPLGELVPEGAIIGLYHATPLEAPAASYGKFFFERGHQLALPRFSDRGSPMAFAAFSDPFEESDLEAGPFGQMQPKPDAQTVLPQVLIMPLVGFTAAGERLGQGGGHYDRWLDAHDVVTTIGLAWDAQLAEEIPMEPHDKTLTAVVTPTRLYGPF